MKKRFFTLKDLAVPISMFLAVAPFSTADEQDFSQDSDRLHLNLEIPTSPVATFKLEDYQTSRVLYDANGDGWCDLWCSFFPKNPKVKGRDSDGDGMTDYEEMVLMQDPDLINPLPRHLTARELMEQERDRKIKQQETSNALQLRHRETILKGNYNMGLARTSPPTPIPTRQEKLKGARDFAEILKELYEPDPNANGEKSKDLRDLKRSPSLPYGYGAFMTKADHLWPGGVFPFHDATGADPSSGSPLAPIGVWDDGKIFEPYPAGYNGRIFFGANQDF
ncbi:MAG: hypothetical protein ACJAVK_002062 [Akkermansiaceae bacterium]|jgi:hypothetical protein